MAFKVAVAVSVFASVDGLRRSSTSNRCGKAGQSLFSGPNISGGDAAECAWRWQVGLKTSPYRPFHFCGGMLISPEWVLTSAMCVNDMYPDEIYVVAGDHNSGEPYEANEQVIRSQNHYEHPNYEFYDDDPDYDIALIKLSSPVKMNGCIGTVCLPRDANEDVPAGTKCWISGWIGQRAGILQEAEVSLLSNPDCQRNTKYSHTNITSRMLCAQGRTRSDLTNACQRDGGGPLVCESSGTWTVHGVSSWGAGGCAGENSPGVWARVTAHLDWIEKTMA